ncbi:MAG: hypothetical protein ACI976_000119 [Aureispira sp.]|jgi:hypothetical protein
MKKDLNLVLQLQNELADVYFDRENSYYEERWKVATKNATNEKYKDYQLEKVEISKKLPTLYFLCDTKDFLFRIDNDMKKWTNEVVMKYWDSTELKKVAFISSEKLTSRLSVLNAVNLGKHHYAIQYFNEEQEAKDWLFA